MPCPRNTFLNGTIPALVNSRVGSFFGTSESLATTVWPRSAKKSRNRLRISLPVIRLQIIYQ
jgi:hypothetical protein